MMKLHQNWKQIFLLGVFPLVALAGWAIAQDGAPPANPPAAEGAGPDNGPPRGGPPPGGPGHHGPGHHRGGPGPHHPPEFAQAMALMVLFDTNHDRRVSAEEIEAAAKIVKAYDKDGDGKITPDELPTPHHGFGGPGGGPPGMGRPGREHGMGGPRGPGGWDRDGGRPQNGRWAQSDRRDGARDRGRKMDGRRPPRGEEDDEEGSDE